MNSNSPGLKKGEIQALSRLLLLRLPFSRKISPLGVLLSRRSSRSVCVERDSASACV